ncbi:MAG: SH3 domain-containing protein [Ruminococcus bicirculans]|uniref:SH3 domain-containing protein n=1 Tax=Ruminococcus bicirculans (ex Wegman et al. 2014) TaxID=1160721 RepID=UPI00265743F2|nr:SH3 domain-containing protein [Ruminococcus bicirculans (ex Wegman et al. 2014)]
MRSKLLAAVLACSAVFGLASCGAMLPESSSETETTTGTAAQRVIETTKTATMGDDYDEDDEDYEGYTTTTSVTAGTLENPDVSIDEGYDPDIIATATKRTTTTTTTTSAETEATKKTTTTKFKKDALFPLGDDVKYPDSIPFLVKSDTSYLNLRYGPSKKYDVIEKIPDGKTINGYGERTDGDGDIWVYVKYNDKSGWVMKELLSGTE